MNTIIQSLGTIVKKENLTSVESFPHGKILCLESQLPYPGYYGTTIPDNIEPKSIFIVTKTVYNDEKIIRAIKSIKSSGKYNFDAVPGTIILQNNSVNIIRIKGSSFNEISTICELFNQHGIEFEKSRKISLYKGIIKIRKFFRIEKLADGIYKDMDVPEYFYIEVPLLINWEYFTEITKVIRYNSGNIIFDAAQTSIYNETGLIDFVRIYNKIEDIENLKSIRENYLKEYNKI